MTVPTTRAELIEWLAAGLREIQHERRSADDIAQRIIEGLDTFATVCPREPTDAVTKPDRSKWHGINDVQAAIAHHATMEPWNIKPVYYAILAASPFAPERGGGNRAAMKAAGE